MLNHSTTKRAAKRSRVENLANGYLSFIFGILFSFVAFCWFSFGFQKGGYDMTSNFFNGHGVPENDFAYKLMKFHLQERLDHARMFPGLVLNEEGGGPGKWVSHQVNGYHSGGK